jgi:SAM-dependent methyltransferase
MNYEEEAKPLNIIWNRQIELFAKYFLIHVRLPNKDQFTLLDVGCGTGTALKIIGSKYPNAQLSGCDLEAENIAISKQFNGKYGYFFVSDIESLNEHWDIIYLSNVLEHLYEWKEKLDNLLEKTNRLYLLVPYQERITSLPKNKFDHSFHINSFGKHSFDYLKTKGYKVNQRIITTPYAWGSSPLRSLLEKYKLDRNKNEYKSEFLVCITREQILMSKPFKPFLYSLFAKYFSILFPIYLNKYLNN